MSIHTMTANPEVKFSFPGLEPGEYEVEYPQIEITFSYLPEPAEVSFVSAKLIDGKGLTPTSEQVNEWARDYLDDAWNIACTFAEGERYG